MSIKVDPKKVDELSSQTKRFGAFIENVEWNVNESISQLVRDTQNQYPELYGRSELNEIERLLNEIRKQAEGITEDLRDKAKILTDAAARYRKDEEAVKTSTKKKYEPVPPSTYYSANGGLSGKDLNSYLQDALFQDPVVQKLHQLALHGTEAEKKEAKEKLDAIFKARNTIARAQVAYSVYKAFGNTYLMEQAHKEAMKQRGILKGYGINEELYGEKVNISEYYKGSALDACSYDPSMQIVKDGKFVQVLMPQDNQYQYLLGLVMKGGAQGAWAQKQLDEIHKQLGEIGRAQVAWHEYKAKGMTKEMGGAHTYAEKVRGILKDKYGLSSAMVDGVGYMHLWTGTGPAGNYLRVQETADDSHTASLTNADEFRKAIIEEAKYWVGKIPYCLDTKITTQVLDRNNPPPYMDCSDFTSSVYKTVLDINIGPTTRDQILRGTEVDLKDLKPGDLILFGKEKGARTPSHVGIYIGNGEFIHEAGSNTNPKNLSDKKQNVKIDKLTNTHWNPRIISFRRIIQDDNTIVNQPSKKTPLPVKEIEIVPDQEDTSKSGDYVFEKELAKFPESYRPMLEKLHAAHPEWRFYADHINVDFNKLIDAEMKSGHVCTSEIKYGYSDKWKDPKFKYDKGYFAASKEAVSYFIDPRNFINENQVFQFLSAKYDANTQNINAVNSVLKDDLKNKGTSFLEAGGDKVSAVFLAAKSTVETGSGDSPLSKGKVNGYEGWFNMYGIGAFDGNAGLAGAKKAKQMGWSTQDKAIVGGGKWIYDEYVSKGQDTLYKMKWNVEGFEKNGSISHQYATHIKDAFIKSSNFAKGLKDVKAPMVFRIPVYNSMPSQISKEPNSAQSKL